MSEHLAIGSSKDLSQLVLEALVVIDWLSSLTSFSNELEKAYSERCLGSTSGALRETSV